MLSVFGRSVSEVMYLCRVVDYEEKHSGEGLSITEWRSTAEDSLMQIEYLQNKLVDQIQQCSDLSNKLHRTKHLEDLQNKLVDQIQQCSDLSNKLHSSEAMSDQIEQMGLTIEYQMEQMGNTIETQQKHLEDLQNKLVDQIQQCSDLSNKLHSTEHLEDLQNKLVDQIEQCSDLSNKLHSSEAISNGTNGAHNRNATKENALHHQACVLRADLEKSMQDNVSLLLKIGREDKLNSDNRNVVNIYHDMSKRSQEFVGISQGMISGTVLQTIVILVMIYKTNWNREASRAGDRVQTCGGQKVGNDKENTEET
ncbi:hypothetical protein V8G54_015671 [Vigna mungo]|uniref:Uncharacterized protein n=1 Tax=Vigna mungo TaxID=3915 RepID=A0AAQ3NJR6_VIGMU